MSIVKGKIYSQGEFILLKVDKDDDSKEEEISFQITVKYTDRDSKQCIQNYNYSFNDKENVFSSEAIENGLALYYYAQGFRKIAKLAVAIRDLETAESHLFYEQQVKEEKVDELIKKEKEYQSEIDKCEKIIEKLVEITSYDNFWNVGTFLKEHYKEIEGLTENKRGDYLKNMMSIYEPSIKKLPLRKENNI